MSYRRVGRLVNVEITEYQVCVRSLARVEEGVKSLGSSRMERKRQDERKNLEIEAREAHVILVGRGGSLSRERNARIEIAGVRKRTSRKVTKGVRK